jgi:hypothetical protein
MNRPFLFAVVLLMSVVSAFADDEFCPTTGKGSIPFRVAYARHFLQSGVNVLSLRVSIGAEHVKAQDILCGVGGTVAAKYPNEKSWNLLIFSDYEVAKNYEAPDSLQNEPKAYIGACTGIRNAGKEQVKCGRW